MEDLLKRSLLLPVCLLLVGAQAGTQAQAPQNVLAASRSIDWSAAGVAGGIPTRTTICSTLSPGATAAQIQSAIANCPTNQVVFLNAGTYNLSTGIDFNGKSNVTLRGAGADRTKLVFTGATGCNFSVGAAICVRSGENNYGPNGGLHTANWTAGYAKGTNTVTLSSTSGLAVGNLLFLDQTDDSSDGYPAAGDIYVCESCSKQGGNTFGRNGRSQVQIVTVTAINGLNVTISPSLYMPNWRAAKNPGAWWGNFTIKGSGVEDLTIDVTSKGSPGFMFFNAVNGWLKGVRSVENSTPPDTFSHVRLLNAARITVRDSYFYGPLNQAVDNYGVTAELASDLLIENNIEIDNPGPWEQNGSDSGSVWAYNYHKGGWVNSVTQHEAGIGMVLYEGNSGTGFTGDTIHGTANFVTQFRNHWYGGANGVTSNTIQWLASYHRFYNVIGNVLGNASNNTYERSAASQTGSEIFSLGENNASITGSSIPTDTRVKATLYRWGNYDTVSGAVRFVAAEVPTGLANFAQALPDTQVLPASLYRSSKPPFFGSVPWPAVGPEVTGGDISGYGGHAYKIPARLCYESLPDDPAYSGSAIRLFNAATCYPNATSLRAPTNLRIIR
jgi:hypothetical protein